MSHDFSASASVPVTGLQIFRGLLALTGLIVVGLAGAQTPPADLFLAELTASWGMLTIGFDLLLLGIAAVAFVAIEAHRLGMRWPWIWVPLALPLPGAFLVPLFFLLRERACCAATADRYLVRPVPAQNGARSCLRLTLPTGVRGSGSVRRSIFAGFL